MEKSTTITKLATALMNFQAQCPTIEYDSTVAVRTDKGSYSFKYASYAVIIKAIREHMHKNGLSFSQLVEPDGAVTTILMHDSGEYLQSSLRIQPRSNSPQEIGSAITYSRRYTLSAILGISTEDDDDGNLASGNTAEKNNSNAMAAKPTSKTPDGKEKPWITEPQLDMVILRLELADPEAYTKALDNFRFSKALTTKLNIAMEKIQKNPPPAMTDDHKEISSALQLLNDNDELKKFWDDRPEMHKDYYFIRLMSLRKLQLKSKTTKKQ